MRHDDVFANPGNIFKVLTEKIGMVDRQYGGLEQFRATRSKNIDNRPAIEKSVELSDSK